MSKSPSSQSRQHRSWPIRVSPARAATAAYGQFMEGLEELSQIKAELLRRGDPLQAQ